NSNNTLHLFHGWHVRAFLLGQVGDGEGTAVIGHAGINANNSLQVALFDRQSWKLDRPGRRFVIATFGVRVGRSRYGIVGAVRIKDQAINPFGGTYGSLAGEGCSTVIIFVGPVR